MDDMSRRSRPSLAAATFSCLLLFLLITAIVTLLYLGRHSDPRLSDRQLSNYFAFCQDLVAAPLLILFVIALLFPRPPRFELPRLGRRGLAICMVLVAVSALAGSHWLFDGFPLSRDEYMADFDARILSGGRLFGSVAAPWRSMVAALQPDFLLRTADGAFWSSAYLPGNAAIRALFELIGARALATPVLAAASAGLVYAVARKLEPDDPVFAAATLLLFATSAQFLLIAMTPYAMTAHLALNLAWLWLALHDRGWSRALAAAVSVLACGLHQLLFHPLFVAPFLPLLWLTGRRRAVLIYAGAIACATLFWLNYWTIAGAITAPQSPMAGLASVPITDRVEDLFHQAMRSTTFFLTADNLLRLLTWQNPFLWVLFVGALAAWRRLPPVAWSLLGGIILTAGAMLALMPFQGHGWGYRYLHGLLGSFALLAAYGWKAIAEAGPDVRQQLQRWLAISVLFSLAILLPLRAWQAEAFVRPYRTADAALSRIPADILIVESEGRWYATDLVRNEPDLSNRPIRLLAARLSKRDAASLCSRYRVRVISRSSPELRGLRAVSFRNERVAADRRLLTLSALGCS
jgi:hypothetical protein